jgi:2-desacetyl-2-hydroxyethyl bacteriochlorophyllide A dehydrogenase
MGRRTLFFTGERAAVIRERADPSLEPDEVRVETVASAISPGTELLLYRGDAPTEMAADETLPALEGDLAYPLAYGYAAVGRVTDCGASVGDQWLDRAVFGFNPHETAFTADPSDLIVLPNDLALDRATLLPSVETAVNFAHDGRPRLGERVVVLGAGLVGLCTTAVLSTFPLAELVVADPVPERRAAAERLGADRVVATAPEVVPERDPGGADLVYELSGNPDALDDAIEAVGYDGRIVVGSWYGTKRANVDLGGRFHRDRITVESSQVSTIDPTLRGRWTNDRRLDAALTHLQDRDDRLVTDTVPFADAPAAYRRLDEQRPPGGLVLTYDRETQRDP